MRGVNGSRLLFGTRRPATGEGDLRPAPVRIAGAPEDFDWAKIFAGATWFHFSGIPRRSQDDAKVTARALAARARPGCGSASIELPREIVGQSPTGRRMLAPLMNGVEVRTSVEGGTVFGVEVVEGASGAKRRAAALCAKRVQDGGADAAPGATADVRVGQRPSSGWTRLFLSAMDRECGSVGAGDSFTGALIFALLRGDGPQKAVEFAVAASTLKHDPRDYPRMGLRSRRGAAWGAGAAVGRGGEIKETCGCRWCSLAGMNRGTSTGHD